jgi:hypothetical protein
MAAKQRTEVAIHLPAGAQNNTPTTEINNDYSTKIEPAFVPGNSSQTSQIKIVLDARQPHPEPS